MDKKKEIIKSVKALVLKKGYKNVSVEDITDRIGIAKGSFYTYFKSKNVLINYILEEKNMRIKRKMNGFFKSIKNVDEAMEKLVRMKLVLTRDEDIKSDLMIVSFFRNIDSLDQKTVKLLMEIENTGVDSVKEILIRYKDEIQIEDNKLDFYSRLIYGIITNYKIFNLFTSDDKDFIRTTAELEKKYMTDGFQNDVKLIIKSIIKILK